MMVQYTDVSGINLKNIVYSYGLDLATFLSLPEEYRDALIHGGFILERKNNIWNSVSERKKVKEKVLLFLRKNK